MIESKQRINIHELASETIQFVRIAYGDGFIPLLRPVFERNKRRYLADCIDSNYKAGSVNDFVSAFYSVYSRRDKLKFNPNSWFDREVEYLKIDSLIDNILRVYVVHGKDK